MSDVSVQIEAASPGAVVAEFEHVGELTVEVQKERIVEAARALRDGPSQYVLLSDVTCADFPDEPGRFRLAYHLTSIGTGARVRLRTWAGALSPEIDSVTSVWPGADWMEREVYDQFGVRFEATPTCAASSTRSTGTATRCAATTPSVAKRSSSRMPCSP